MGGSVVVFDCLPSLLSWLDGNYNILLLRRLFFTLFSACFLIQELGHLSSKKLGLELLIKNLRLKTNFKLRRNLCSYLNYTFTSLLCKCTFVSCLKLSERVKLTPRCLLCNYSIVILFILCEVITKISPNKVQEGRTGILSVILC